jgi:cyclase
VTAALAASVFHYGEIKIRDVKSKMKESQIEVRL